MAADPFDILERFLQVPSTTGQEGPYARLVAEVLRERGYAVETPEAAPGRPNVVARPPGTTPGVWFCTHLDCVPPELPHRREGDRFYGRGAADTKGPLVAMLLAGDALRAEGHAAGYALVVGEEVDHVGAEAFAATEGELGGARIILGEPTSNRVVQAQKGLLKVDVSAEGIAGHSAFPERGVSAVHRLLSFLWAVERADWPRDEVLGETTWNVGRIEGGVAGNVFAPHASAQVVLRLVEPAASARERLEGLAGEGVRVETVAKNDPVRFAPPAGFETCVIPFNSDASFLAPLGAPIWLCGPGAIEVAHSEDEHIERASLDEGVRVYTRLARAALGG